MKNIHVIPTDKPSRLYLVKDKLKLSPLKFTNDEEVGWLTQHIYITSDEEIKDEEWHLHYYEGDPGISKSHNGASEFINLKAKEFGYNKIILTTDQDLIADGVQGIDDEFLEWFVNNPSCEEVEVVGDDCYYEIIIPKEEPKQAFDKSKYISGIDPYDKTETLEEAAERLSKNAYKKHSVKDDKLSLDEQIQRSGGFIVGFKEGFIESAKWQQERMYSEEDMKKAFQSSSHTNMLDIYNSFEDFIEQNKKK
jgi:hypothetical protein